jgi:hypothetical protein
MKFGAGFYCLEKVNLAEPLNAKTIEPEFHSKSGLKGTLRG